MGLQAYGVNKVLVATWFVSVLLLNTIVFAALLYKINFKKRSRSLVLLLAVYYIIYSMVMTLFSFSSHLLLSKVCPLIVGSAVMAVVIGNIFCVLGVTIERFVYIVYALQYKRIITPPRILMFTVFLLCKSIAVIACSALGVIKFHTVSTYKPIVICTVDKSSFSSKMISYVFLVVYIVAFLIIPILWLRIHCLRAQIKRLCRNQKKSAGPVVSVLKKKSHVTNVISPPPSSNTPDQTDIPPVRLIRQQLPFLHNSPGRIVRVNTPQELRLRRKRQQVSSKSTHLSSTKSSKHTIKIFLVSYVILKSHYILLFPPFIEVLCKTDSLAGVMLLSFADSLFGCLLLVAPDVELKQVFFRFFRNRFMGTFKRSNNSNSRAISYQ